MIYDSKIKFMDTCPLFFGQGYIANEMQMMPNAYRYVQTYAPADTVHVQFQYLETGRTLTFNVHDWDTERILKTFTCIETNMSGTYIYDGWLKMTGISGGVYFTVQSETSYTIANTITGSYDEYQMGIIDITNSLHTIGIQYYDSENRFGTRFGAYSAENTFTFRVDGGFIPSGFTPKNDMSVFYDQNQSPSLTYSMPNATHRLVLGNDNGLPWYMVNLINTILGCDVTVIRGQQWVATEVLKQTAIINNKQVVEVPMGKKTNRMSQNIGSGDIFITDRYGYKITTSNNENFIL